MPKYLFWCRNCNEYQEYEHGMLEPHPTKCRCGGQLARKFTNPGIVLRGGGWTRDELLLSEPTELQKTEAWLAENC